MAIKGNVLNVVRCVSKDVIEYVRIFSVIVGLATSSCASTLWVERHSVPEACLSHPWVVLVLSFRLVTAWLSFLLVLSLQCRVHLIVAI